MVQRCFEWDYSPPHTVCSSPAQAQHSHTIAPRWGGTMQKYHIPHVPSTHPQHAQHNAVPSRPCWDVGEAATNSQASASPTSNNGAGACRARHMPCKSNHRVRGAATGSVYSGSDDPEPCAAQQWGAEFRGHTLGGCEHGNHGLPPQPPTACSPFPKQPTNNMRGAAQRPHTAASPACATAAQPTQTPGKLKAVNPLLRRAVRARLPLWAKARRRGTLARRGGAGGALHAIPVLKPPLHR